MFNDQVLQNCYSQLPDVRVSLQALGHFAQQQTHQEMIPAVVLSEAVLQTLICKVLLVLLVLSVLSAALISNNQIHFLVTLFTSTFLFHSDGGLEIDFIYIFNQN